MPAVCQQLAREGCIVANCSAVADVVLETIGDVSERVLRQGMASLFHSDTEDDNVSTCVVTT
jgi:hypothetical protein